ncbi:TetR family transcriptional regulator [Saccharothrix luteola]|uniref:TetR family transcriptional regulator n=1 Tax=Saccharothrix luteola TaxID=2893018 RepID=UPI001E4CCF5B|nr:TetR family transcriptional regulator [Saccharothrix luteola]MCC8248547.1 TetR family transcriptional regulator [Saccharothrix luteola]
MAEGALTAEDILSTTEDVLRRFGPAKATVVDVARALGVSHGSVYRHFPTKTALREAVTQRWLDRAHAGLAELAAADTPASQRLRDWLAALFESKRKKALGDPELFATYSVLVNENSSVVASHIAAMVEDLTRIVADGVASGDFTTADPAVSAKAVFDATARFHDPAHAGDWSAPDVDAAFDAVVSLLVAGLQSGR